MTSRMQSCVDHIKTSLDVDPWAAEMVEKIFTEYDRRFDKVLQEETALIDRVIEIIDEQVRDVEKSDLPKSDMGRGMIAMARCIKGLISALKAD